MATAYPPVVAECDAMSTPIVVRARRSTRKSAPDQKSGRIRLTKADAKLIGKYGYARILEETRSEELASDFERAMLRILPASGSR